MTWGEILPPEERNLPPLNERKYQDPFLPGRKRVLYCQALAWLDIQGEPYDNSFSLARKILPKIHKNLKDNCRALSFNTTVLGQERRIEIFSGPSNEAIYEHWQDFFSFKAFADMLFDQSQSFIRVSIFKGAKREKSVVFLRNNNEIKAVEKQRDVTEERVIFWESVFKDIGSSAIKPDLA